MPEPLSVLPSGSSHADLVVRALVAEAERLMTAPRPTVSVPPTGGAQTPTAPVAIAHSAGGAPNTAGFPRVVYDAYPPDGGSPHAGALPDSLLFDAAFESANLRRAVQVLPLPLAPTPNPYP